MADMTGLSPSSGNGKTHMNSLDMPASATPPAIPELPSPISLFILI
jgi:hypothetical protein